MSKFLFLDTETTGLSSPRIVSVAYALEGEQGVYEAFFNPPDLIQIQATMVHGITTEKAQKFSRFESSYDKEKLQNLLDENILVTHNLAFDKSVLENEGLIVRDGMCNVKFARAVFTEFTCHKLQWLRYVLGLNSDGVPHSAGGDVMVLRELFTYMCNRTINSMNGDQILHDLLRSLIENFNPLPKTTYDTTNILPARSTVGTSNSGEQQV